MQLRLETKDYSQNEWHQIASQFDDLSLIQTWEYGEAKSRTGGWGVVRHIFLQGREVIGAAQAVIKRVPLFNQGLVWINRAPLFQRSGVDPDFILLQEMLKALRQYWVDQRKMYLRVAPPVDEMTSTPLHLIPNSQWMSAVIDLTRSPEQLRYGLDKKWRNCLTKAEKSGLTYESGTDEVHMSELIEDYRALIARKDFSSVTPEFLLVLQTILPPDRKMVVLRGRRGAERLGSILIARYGDTAEYLIGAVSIPGRLLNAGQFLLWNAMVQMRRMGLRRFDLGGMHPEKTPKGIFHFKQGVCGVPYTLVGEFDAAGGLIARGIKLMAKFRS